MARVFACDQIDFAQHAQRAMGDVFEIADWSRDNEQLALHAGYSVIARRNGKALFDLCRTGLPSGDGGYVCLVRPRNTLPPRHIVAIIATSIDVVIATVAAVVIVTVNRAIGAIEAANRIQLVPNLRPQRG